MIADQPFRTGDVVSLRSGGPSMTVDAELRKDGIITVFWFEGNIAHQNAFPPEMLRLEIARERMTLPTYLASFGRRALAA
jgi:uncharacterized protein YodC (DUF2158 family)